MPSNAPKSLPISVVIPTRDSMDKLPRHLAHHAPLFARCAEIIHCDSYSLDETKHHLASTLAHPNLQQVDHPPGLYQSWNFAIAQCTQPFIYISTVGDQIDLAGLQHLLDIAVETNADLVISPPRFVDETSEPDRKIIWPIHAMIDDYKISKPRIIPQAVIWAETLYYAPESITGSAASCLFRTSFLQPRAFPSTFYGMGDSAWSTRHIADAHCAITPTPVATFLLHAKSYESDRAINEKANLLFARYIADELIRLRRSPTRLPLYIINETSRLVIAKHHTAICYRKLISLRHTLHGFWFVSRYIWKIRYLRHRLRNKTHLLRLNLEKQLAQIMINTVQ
jgi:hypothetical protein